MVEDAPAARVRWALAALAGLVACGDDAQLDRVERAAVFTPPVIDFGPRALDELHQLATLLSTSGERLSVTDVVFDPPVDAFDARTSDGSTLRGTFVAGGRPVEIVVRYFPTAEGPHDTTMVVRFASTEARVPIVASGRATRPASARLSPSTVLFEPAIEVGRDATQLVTVINDGERRGRLSVRGLAAPYSITAPGSGALPALDVEPGESVTVELHFRPTAPGSFDATAELALGDGPAATLTIRGEALAAGALACETLAVGFGDVARGVVERRPLRCTVSGGPYTLASLALEAPVDTPFSITGAPANGARITALDLEIVFTASGLPATHVATLALTSATGAETRIALAGRVVAPAPTSTDLTVVLTWSTDQTDFDLHLVRAPSLPFSADDCYFERKHVDWGAAGAELDDPFLDTDDTSGLGPETVNLARAAEVYEVYVQYYGHAGATAPPTEVTLTHWLRGVSTTQVRTMSACGNTWHAGTLRFDGPTPVLVPRDLEVDTWRTRTRDCF
ncbi:choice-of-anchor D domain-containing protein [Myxococcota bacterium]|nr:choice-of-anchor D domain-containing protein [Myxococcota bacterium]